MSSSILPLNLSDLAIFQRQFVEIYMFDEIGGLEPRYIELREPRRVRGQNNGRRQIELVASDPDILVEFFFLVFSVIVHDFVFDDFFILKSFYPNFHHMGSIHYFPRKGKKKFVGKFGKGVDFRPVICYYMFVCGARREYE